MFAKRIMPYYRMVIYFRFITDVSKIIQQNVRLLTHSYKRSCAVDGLAVCFDITIIIILMCVSPYALSPMKEVR